MNCKYRIEMLFCIVLIVSANAVQSAANPPAKSRAVAVTSEVKRGGQKPQHLSVDIRGVDTLALPPLGPPIPLKGTPK